MSWGRYVLWPKCLGGELSRGRYDRGPKSPAVKLQYEKGPKCLGTEMSGGRIVQGPNRPGAELSQGRIVQGPKQPHPDIKVRFLESRYDGSLI